MVCVTSAEISCAVAHHERHDEYAYAVLVRFYALGVQCSSLCGPWRLDSVFVGPCTVPGRSEEGGGRLCSTVERDPDYVACVTHS